MILCYLVLSLRMYHFLTTFGNSSEDVSLLAHALLVSYDGVMYPNCFIIVVGRCPFSCGQCVWLVNCIRWLALNVKPVQNWCCLVSPWPSSEMYCHLCLYSLWYTASCIPSPLLFDPHVYLVICVQCYIGPYGVLVPTGTMHSNNEFGFEFKFICKSLCYHCSATCPINWVSPCLKYSWTCKWTSWLSLEEAGLWKGPVLWHSHPSTVNRHKSSWRVMQLLQMLENQKESVHVYFYLVLLIHAGVLYVILPHKWFLKESKTV